MIFDCINGPRKGDILIDMTLNLFLVRDFQEHVFIKVSRNWEMVWSTISSFSITCIKTFSWKSLTTNKVKGHIYLDKIGSMDNTVSLHRSGFRIAHQHQRNTVFSPRWHVIFPGRNSENERREIVFLAQSYGIFRGTFMLQNTNQ